MSKTILKGFEARERIKAGIDESADAVRPTLGAIGMSAIIDLGGYDPIESDDGITVLRNLDFKDRYKALGHKMLRKASQRTNDEGGDGTSTTAVVTQALVESVYREIGHSSEKIIDVVNKLDDGLKEAIQSLSDVSRMVQDDDIERVATIASLDDEIGRIIAKAYNEIGRDGIISIEESPIVGYSSEVVRGARFRKGFISPYFVNEPEKLQCSLQNPWVLIVNRRIAVNSQLKILDAIVKSGNTDLLIIAENVEGEALASLILNTQRKAINCCCVTPPYTMDKNREWMNDIAVLTGARVVTEEAGVLLENIDASFLGQAEKVIVTKDTTTIINGVGNPEEIDVRANSVRTMLATEMLESNKQFLRERISVLTGGVGVIRVGAITDTELRAKKYKVEDAVNATKSALEEGIVEGGGTAYARIAAELPKDHLFKEALLSPLRQMCVNAGEDFSDIYIKIVKTDQGYNFKTKQFEDMFETGVIDPFKVMRLALESAVSVAKSLARGEIVIIEDEEE